MSSAIKRRKAVVLISGGLDSMLAAKMIMEQGIEVEGLNFYTGFCHSGHTSAIRNQKKGKTPRNDALWVCEQLGIPLHIEDIVEPYKEVLLNPKYGYGQNLNPCLDCKIFMVKKAHEWMVANGFDFIVTGEVVGQRPKSQRKETMPVVESRASVQGLLVRPLCAKHLPPTIPEEKGWLERDKLLDFHGRNRKPQMALAKQFDFNEYAQPAGGCCVLTDENYSRRLEDMWAHRGHRDYDMDDIIILKAGRHIRPKANYKLIVGRDESENNFLRGYKKVFTHLYTPKHAGPLVLIDGKPSFEDLTLAARICARYSGGKNEKQVEIEINTCQGETHQIQVAPITPDEMDNNWIL
jgi:tRNA U34 2-thiouridine synthase MnmA/TrmU